MNKIGFGKSKKKESLEEPTGSCEYSILVRSYSSLRTNDKQNYSTIDFSRRNSMELGEASRESEFVVLKERRLVPRTAIYDGMLRFSFLLETCQPGSVPDQHLMAAILDLVRETIARYTRSIYYTTFLR